MQKTFIMILDGVPSVTAELPAYPLSRLHVMDRSWEHWKAFDGVSRYEARSKQQPTYSIWQRILARVIYNPHAGFGVTWEAHGACNLGEIVDEVEKGLETDDDVIQQWFSSEEVLKLLRSAKTFDEMVDRVKCVCGEFEGDERLMKLVEEVLNGEHPNHS
jgi:hypothetical protein